MADAPCPVGCGRTRDHRDLTCDHCREGIPATLLDRVEGTWRRYQTATGPAIGPAWGVYEKAWREAIDAASTAAFP